MQPGRVRSTVEAPLARRGFVVEDVTVTPAGRRSVVRIAVDRDLRGLDGDATTPVPPLSLDDVAEATRVVDEALDADASLGSAPYVLEVSSPGLDRPLTTHRQLRRNVGRLVTLTLTDGSVVGGRVARVEADRITLTADAAAGAGTGTGGVPVAAVRTGRVVLEFGRADEDGVDDPDGVDDVGTDEGIEEED